MGVATNGLKTALDRMGKHFVINEGDGAFYGRKLDFHMRTVWVVPGSAAPSSWIPAAELQPGVCG